MSTDREAEPMLWLRYALPRRARWNHRSLGEQDGGLVTKVWEPERSLPTWYGGADPASGLIGATLASEAVCEWA